MKQIVQNINSKQGIELIDLPRPLVEPGYLIIETKKTLISLGTERTIVEFGNANLARKIQQRPDQVKQVFNRLKSGGITKGGFSNA